MDENQQMDTLDIKRIIGFNGTVPNGLQVHPDNKHLIYPLGFNIVVEDMGSNEQEILSAHTNKVTCIAINRTGNYIASGQVNYMGFKASIKLWDYESKKPIKDWTLHKVKVEALAFSTDSDYLISLGGCDCGAVVVWDLKSGEALCGSPAQVESAGITTCLATSICDNNVFVTGGSNTLRVWHLDHYNRKIRPTEVRLGGGTKRVVTCIEMADHSPDYPFFFCGTSTGDIMVINIKFCQLQVLVPIKDKFSEGVTALNLVAYKDSVFDFLVGTGDGLVGRYAMKVSVDKTNHLQATWKHHANVKPWVDPLLKKRSPITSIAKRGAGHMFFVGAANCQIYKFNYAELSACLMKTCHSKPINDVTFAHGDSDLIVTCSFEEIRVWFTKSGQELTRYTVPNMTCNAICITRSGTSIFSAWDDGMIRVFGFSKDKAGKVKQVEKYNIPNAHNKGVTAIGVTSRGDRLVSGGGEGQVRVWNLVEDPVKQNCSRGVLLANMKEHKGKVTAIQIHPNDKLCVSASTDGSTIIWCLQTNTRSQIVLANTLFRCVCFGAKGAVILTSGSDSKIGYWDVLDGSLLRELEGSAKSAINTMDISCDGLTYVTGGEDRLLKVWDFELGTVTNLGLGHSEVITKARICPNQRYIVSVSADGAIHIWDFPANLRR